MCFLFSVDPSALWLSCMKTLASNIVHIWTQRQAELLWWTPNVFLCRGFALESNVNRKDWTHCRSLMCSVLTILKTICFVLVPGTAGGSWGVTQPLIIPLLFSSPLFFYFLLFSTLIFSSLPVPSVLFTHPYDSEQLYCWRQAERQGLVIKNKVQ